MSLFNKIAQLLSEEDKQKGNGTPESISTPSPEKKDVALSATSLDEKNSTPKQPEQECPHVKKGDGALPLESREQLLKAVIRLFRQIDDVEQYRGKRMLLWIDTDYLAFQSYDTEQYRQLIQQALVNEYGILFEVISFSIGSPAEELHCTPVGNSGKVYMQVLDERPVRPICKASISIFRDAGSLKKDKYILSSEEMKEKKISAYNIGAGEFPQIPSGYRQNHIAIDDCPTSPMIEKNKFVSRMHAHIGYSDKFGFYLQVERDGTRLMGKRTRIFRGEQIIEMENQEVKEPLQDGDLIELGKAVVLRYVLIDK